MFVPLPVLAGFLAVLFAIAWFAFPTRYMSVTAFATFTWFFLAYEWSHYLIHSPYVPRTPLFRAVWRAHILHHYKNEQYWFGVTNPVADYVLRTHPAKDSVECQHRRQRARSVSTTSSSSSASRPELGPLTRSS